MGDRRLRDQNEAAEVDRELPVDVLQLGILDPARDADPGRVDEQVETPGSLDVLALYMAWKIARTPGEL